MLDEPQRSALIKSLASDDPMERRDAARALGEACERAAVEALVVAVRRPEQEATQLLDHTSRAAAAVALGRIGDPSAAEALLDVIEDPFNLGTAASTALGRLRPPPIAELVRATRDASSWRRARAASALGEIGDATTFDAIAELLDDPIDDVARAAASAFEKLRDERAVPRLCEVLRSPERSAFVRSYAAMALGALGNASSASDLLLALDSDDPLLRRASARALCRLDDPALRDRLAALATTDPDRSVRDVVARYLSPRPGQRRH